MDCQVQTNSHIRFLIHTHFFMCVNKLIVIFMSYIHVATAMTSISVISWVDSEHTASYVIHIILFVYTAIRIVY